MSATVLIVLVLLLLVLCKVAHKKFFLTGMHTPKSSRVRDGVRQLATILFSVWLVRTDYHNCVMRLTGLHQADRISTRLTGFCFSFIYTCSLKGAFNMASPLLSLSQLTSGPCSTTSISSSTASSISGISAHATVFLFSTTFQTFQSLRIVLMGSLSLTLPPLSLTLPPLSLTLPPLL